MFHAIKSRLDHNNIFDAGKLVEDRNGAKLERISEHLNCAID